MDFERWFAGDNHHLLLRRLLYAGVLGVALLKLGAVRLGEFALGAVALGFAVALAAGIERSRRGLDKAAWRPPADYAVSLRGHNHAAPRTPLLSP